MKIMRIINLYSTSLIWDEMFDSKEGF